MTPFRMSRASDVERPMAVEIRRTACPSVRDPDEYCDMMAMRLCVWAPLSVFP